MALRKILVSILGHVDHGKTSLLDQIRRTSVQEKEAGGITQAIGASNVPKDTIQKICKKLPAFKQMKFSAPGLLFIDTPGHAAFTSLRKRGGSLADIAVLIVDINEGFKPQTIESIEILKFFKTPFIVAANKIDVMGGWRESKDPILANIKKQEKRLQNEIDTKLYELVGRLHDHGFESERFDRVADFSKQIGIVPISAKTGEGIPELLMVMTALAQKFLEECLQCNIDSPGKGTILEVKEEKGLGTTLDVIIYDGTIKVNDTVVIGAIGEPIVTKIRALLEPAPLAEMRDKKARFCGVKKVEAAMGVKIAAPGLDNAVAGMPVRVANDNVDAIKEEVQAEIEEVLVETDKEGIIIKADTIGSLEALTKLLKEKDVQIRKAGVGEVSKKDIADSESSLEKDPLDACILVFNLPVSDDIKTFGKNVKIIHNDIIYKLIEDFEEWQVEKRKELEAKELDGLVKPAKMRVMPNYVFRQSNPAIVGCDVLVGGLKVGMPIMKDGKTISQLKSIQHEKDTLSKVEAGKQVALAFPGVTVGRQVNENDTLYSGIPEADFRKLKELKKYLKKEEIEVMKEIAEMKRRKNPLWGV
ncbi:translation initiation factor IF-2 [Nanoarchaeota archaeon]